MDLIIKMVTKFQDESGSESFVVKFGIDGPGTKTFILAYNSFL